MMNIIESIRTFIKNCPCLPDYYKSIGVDHLSDEVTSYTIEQTPANPIVKRYIDGSAKKQCLFVFASREAYGADVRQNLDNLGFYFNFANWLEESTREGNLPVLEDEFVPLELEAQTPGYLYDANVSRAQYRIQCRFVYLEKGKL